jgi:hypothetical protein
VRADVGFGFAIALYCLLFVVPYVWVVRLLWKGARSARTRGVSGRGLTKTERASFAPWLLSALLFLSFGIRFLALHQWFLAAFFAVMLTVTSAAPALRLYIRLHPR